MLRRRAIVFPNTINTTRLFRKKSNPQNAATKNTTTSKNATAKNTKSKNTKSKNTKSKNTKSKNTTAKNTKVTNDKEDLEGEKQRNIFLTKILNDRSRRSREDLEIQEQYLRENPSSLFSILEKNRNEGDRFDNLLGNVPLIPQSSSSSKTSSSSNKRTSSSSVSSVSSNKSKKSLRKASIKLTNGLLGVEDFSLFEFANNTKLIETIENIYENKIIIDSSMRFNVEYMYNKYLEFSNIKPDEDRDDLRIRFFTLMCQNLFPFFKEYIPELEIRFLIHSLICYYFSVKHSNNKHCIRLLKKHFGPSFPQKKRESAEIQVRKCLLYLSSLSVIPKFNYLFMNLHGGKK